MSLYSKTLFRASVYEHTLSLNDTAYKYLKKYCGRDWDKVYQEYDKQPLYNNLHEYIHSFNCYHNINYKP